MKFYTREEFKAIPLQFVLVPSLDAPVLVHDDAPMFTDVTNRQCLALPKLDEMRVAYPRTKDSMKRELFLRELRLLWCQMVDQACCYTWPSRDGIVRHYEFADA